MPRQTEQAKFLHLNPPPYRLFPQCPLGFGRVLIRRVYHRPKPDRGGYPYCHGAESVNHSINQRLKRPPDKTDGIMYRHEQMLNKDIKFFRAMIDRLHPALIARWGLADCENKRHLVWMLFNFVKKVGIALDGKIETPPFCDARLPDTSRFVVLFRSQGWVAQILLEQYRLLIHRFLNSVGHAFVLFEKKS